MANIHLNTSGGGGRIDIDKRSQSSDVSLKDKTMPKYVGARAEVTRTEEGVRIWLKDYLGETEEIVADGEDGEDGVGIASITKTGTSGLVDTYTITYTDSTTSTFTVTNGQDGTSEDAVTDVQVDGSSVVTDGVASIGTATSSLAGAMSSTDKSKLDGIQAGAEKNEVTEVTQVTVSGTGSNAVRITARTLGDNTTTYNVAPTTPATESKNGLMSATDKAKLDGVQAGAQVNPGNATTSAAGLMSADDKSKLDGVEASAEKNVVTGVTQVTTSGTGANAIRITARHLGDTTQTYNVAPSTTASTSKEGLMSATDKTKLNGIASGAEVNVQSDWNESDSTSDAYIANKPTIPSKTSDLTNDSGFITLADLPIYNGGVS